MKTLNQESMKVGLSMNRDKTQLVTKSKPKALKIGDQPLEYVQEYKYLGQLISYEDQKT